MQLGVFACPCTWICLLLASVVSIKAEALALEEALREGLPEVDRWAWASVARLEVDSDHSMGADWGHQGRSQSRISLPVSFDFILTLLSLQTQVNGRLWSVTINVTKDRFGLRLPTKWFFVKVHA